MSTTEADNSIPPEAGPDEKHSSIVEVPEVALTPIDLPGQPASDKGFVTPSGTRLRARVVPLAYQETRAPVNGNVVVAPSGVSLSLTLAVLNADMSVAKDASGALLITDLHEIVWTDIALSNPAFDPEEHLMQVLRQQAYVLETRVSKRAAMSSVLANWGAAPAASQPAETPLTPATSSMPVQDMISQAAEQIAKAQVDQAVTDAIAAERRRAEEAAASEKAPPEDDTATPEPAPKA